MLDYVLSKDTNFEAPGLAYVQKLNSRTLGCVALKYKTHVYLLFVIYRGKQSFAKGITISCVTIYLCLTERAL